MFKLRAYQEKQYDFLNSVKGVVKGLESPTGTGKSIVFLEYVKNIMKEDKIVVLTTGFNELVFQMKRDAISMGLDPVVIIGSGHLIPNCSKSGSFEGFEFSENLISECSSCDMDDPRRNKCINCSKVQIMRYLERPIKKFIITNHSYFLVMKDYIKADIVIVDEAHTFGDFYMSNNTMSLNKKDVVLLEKYMSSVKSPTSMILKMTIDKSMGINTKLLENVGREMKMYFSSTDLEINSFVKKMEGIFAERAFDNYLEYSNGEYIKTKFFSRFDLSSPTKNPEIVITSATLDDYTLKMFSCENKNQVYKQREDRARYSQSYLVSVYDDFSNGLSSFYKDFRDSHNFNNGLILCTSNISVDNARSIFKKDFPDVKIFSKSSEFKKYEGKKVLIGSKRFYQGVNIPGLDFVILDKLPFSVYDDKFKYYSYYIEKVTKENAWSGYTLPLMFNSLLQGIGRLWRKNDIENSEYDHGLVAIFDERLEKQFNYVEKRLKNMKPGINLIIRDRKGNNTISDERSILEVPKRTRNKIVKEVTAEESNIFILESNDDIKDDII